MVERCECGGMLKSTTLKEFDFTPVAGIPSLLRNTRGFLCQSCNLPGLDGMTINSVLRTMTTAIVKQPDRLAADHARFLRKRMRLTQQSLADRMGVARETVADWERGKDPISAQHDLVLRALVIAELMRTPRNAPTKADVVEAIGSVRTGRPTGKGPFVVENAA